MYKLCCGRGEVEKCDMAHGDIEGDGYAELYSTVQK